MEITLESAHSSAAFIKALGTGKIQPYRAVGQQVLYLARCKQAGYMSKH